MEKNKMTAEEMAKSINEKIEKAATKEEVAAFQKEFENLLKGTLTAEESKIVKQELASAMTKIKALEEKGTEKTEVSQSLYDAVKSAIEKNPDNFNAIKNAVKTGNWAGVKPLEIEVKSPVTIGVGNTIGSTALQNSITDFTGIVSTLRKRATRYLEGVTVGSMNSTKAYWIEETDEQGAPIMLGENVTKPQASVIYVEKDIKAEKIAVRFILTEEMLEDLTQLVSFIQNNMLRRLEIVEENQLIAGNGVTPQLKGANEYAVNFNGGGLVHKIKEANELDVIEAVANQTKLAFGRPSNIYVHPTTMAAIRLIKDEQGRPIWKDYVTPSGEFNYSGMNVIETLALTPGEFLGGETEVLNVRYRTPLQIRFGLGTGDFENNRQTGLIEKRLAQFVSANDVNVLIKGDFEQAKALIDEDNAS